MLYGASKYENGGGVVSVNQCNRPVLFMALAARVLGLSPLEVAL